MILLLREARYEAAQYWYTNVGSGSADKVATQAVPPPAVQLFLPCQLSSVAGPFSPVHICWGAWNNSGWFSRIPSVYDISYQRSRRLKKIRHGQIDNQLIQQSKRLKPRLPALVPELAYKDLDIQSGDGAASAFQKLASSPHINPLEWERIEAELKEYCARDTLVMVKILDYLRSASGSI